VNGNVIPDTISGSCGRACRLEFLSPYADDEAANRPVLLHQLSDATSTQKHALNCSDAGARHWDWVWAASGMDPFGE